MTQNVTPVAGRSRSLACPIGTTYFDMAMHGIPSTVTAVPGGGGSLALAYSTTPRSAGLGASAVWVDWPSGLVTANTSATLVSPITGLRVIASVAAGTVEVIG